MALTTRRGPSGFSLALGPAGLLTRAHADPSSDMLPVGLPETLGSLPAGKAWHCGLLGCPFAL
eukprot:12418535-Alexandrium_andersonii.AAC.1